MYTVWSNSLRSVLSCLPSLPSVSERHGFDFHLWGAVCFPLPSSFCCTGHPLFTIDRHADKHVDRQTCRKTDKQTDMLGTQVGMLVGTVSTCMHMCIHSGRQTTMNFNFQHCSRATYHFHLMTSSNFFMPVFIIVWTIRCFLSLCFPHPSPSTNELLEFVFIEEWTHISFKSLCCLSQPIDGDTDIPNSSFLVTTQSPDSMKQQATPKKNDSSSVDHYSPCKASFVSFIVLDIGNIKYLRSFQAQHLTSLHEEHKILLHKTQYSPSGVKQKTRSVPCTASNVQLALYTQKRGVCCGLPLYRVLI